jgi:Lrp/AsnC family leucine-responsive transcriptional regulator
MNKAGELDQYDQAILHELALDSRTSIQELGSRIGLSSTPCWNRIKALEAAGVIQGFGIRVDPAKLGFLETVIIHVTLENHTDATVDAFQRADVGQRLPARLRSAAISNLRSSGL